MRIITPRALAALTTKQNAEPRRSLLRRLDRYTRWAFNPQPELTSRYDRAA